MIKYDLFENKNHLNKKVSKSAFKNIVEMQYENHKHSAVTEKVIKAYYKVYNTLGFGFLEKVYENAMFIELKNMGLFVEKQRRIKVFYESLEVGDYFADLIINEKVIVELKAAEALCQEHEFQLINYLKATEIEVGLLLNFGKKPEFKRKVFSNEIPKKVNEKGVSNTINQI